MKQFAQEYPEFLSKLNYYISAIDDTMKKPEDNPTLGLLLCHTKSNTKVEYVLRGMTQPLGVAEYQTSQIIENLKSSLLEMHTAYKQAICVSVLQMCCKYGNKQR